MAEKLQLIPIQGKIIYSTVKAKSPDFFHFFPFIRPWRIFLLFLLGTVVYIVMNANKPPNYYIDVVNTLPVWPIKDGCASRVEEHMKWFVNNQKLIPPLRKFERRYRVS
jgi:hypothetical protein